MVRKRSIGFGLAPGVTATPEDPVVSADPRRCAGPMSALPFPADRFAVLASPRACHTSAPPRIRVVEDRSNGATEHSSRGCQAVGLAARVISASTRRTKDTWQSRVPESPGASRGSPRCHRCKDATGDSAKGTWGDIFGTDDEARDQASDSEEVVVCLSTTVGTDRTHGVLRDSGVAALRDPGVSLLTLIQDKEIRALAAWGNSRRNCWLSGAGFSGGSETDRKSRRVPQDQRTTWAG
jgi:hypothetical protein